MGGRLTEPGRRAPAARGRAGAALGAFGGGVLLGQHAIHLPSASWFAAACAAAAAVLLARGPWCRAAMLLGVAALGAGWVTLRVQEVPADSATRWIGPAPTPARVEGLVLAAPRPVLREDSALHPARGGGPGWTIVMALGRAETDVGWRRVSGRVRVFVDGEAAPPGPGQAVRVAGLLSPVRERVNPGTPDRAAWARQSGEVGVLGVPAAAAFESIPTEGMAARAHAAWRRALGALRERAWRATGLRDDRDPGDAMVAALVLGNRGPAFREHAETFARTGTAHLIAVSGFHLTLLAGLALLVVRATGERGWVEPALVAGLVLGYLLIVPAQPPIVRAGAMVIVLLAADALGRRYDRIALLAWIGLGVLIWRPLDVGALGYQLSFGITALLLWMGELQRAAATPEVIAGPRGPIGAVLLWGRRLIWASVACWLVSSPAIAVQTGVFSPIAPIASLAALPTVLMALELGYLTAAVGAVLGPVEWLAGWCAWAGLATIWIAGRLESLPGAWWTVGRLSWAWGAAATLWALWFVARPRWRDARLWAAAAVVLGWGWAETRIASRPHPGVVLRIDTLAVGDGSCHLLRSGGEALLWDAGSLTPGLERREIPDALRALGVTRVDAAVVTHANLDHYNMLPELAQRLGLRTLYTTAQFVAAASPGSGPGIVMEAMGALGVEVRVLSAGDRLELGRSAASVLWPPEGLDPRGVLASNDTSMVALFEAPTRDGHRRVLLTGDIQAHAISRLLETPPRAEVLELPHHGSPTPEAAVFVSAVSPSVVLQSTGPSRADHPAWTGQRQRRAWWVTHTHGACWAEVRADGSVVSGSVVRGALREGR